MPNPIVLFPVCVLAWQPPAPAPPDTPRVVLDSSLREHPGRLVGVNAGGVTIRDPAGRLGVISGSEAVAILPDLGALGESREPAASGGMLLLADGQVVPGKLGSGGGGGESVIWESDALGQVAAPLELVSRIVLRPGPRALPVTTSSDVVLLTNGDIVQGFVAHVDGGVGVERDGMLSRIPAERVSEVVLTGSARPAHGTWVWLGDGSVIEVVGFEVGADGIARCVPALSPERELRRDARDVHAVVFDVTRVRGLGSLEWKVVGTGGRRFAPPPVIGDVSRAPAWAADIELPGPMDVEWTLPAGARRVAMTAEMPPASRVWGDCEVVVRTGTREVWRLRLNADRPAGAGAFDIDPGAPLRVTVEAGERGGIQDRVVLRRPIVLMEP